MTKRQRESTAKYLYDLSKGVILITVIGPVVSGQFSWTLLFVGLSGTLGFFAWAYWLEGRS
ncbi:MAG: hypothetical protein AAB368_05655 [bacterium]